MLSKIELLHGYKDFSLFYHLVFFLFLFWNLYIKQKGVIVPDKYLKILGVIAIIMGVIFYSYGDELINN